MQKSNNLEMALILVVDALRELDTSQLTRLQILDSQIEALNRTLDRLTDAVNDLQEEMLQFRADRQLCARLNVITKTGNTKGPRNNEEHDINKKFSNWH